MRSDTCREKLKGKREVYRRIDGRQELQCCIRSGISQAANGVHSAAALYGLAFGFFQNKPSCTVLNSLQSTLFVPQQPYEIAVDLKQNVFFLSVPAGL